ncbi:MAG: hypothetical protein CSYNP_01213 [Syntrophus sp. SKADARSKE-3]|nr:hypothetical protein [Syntrophus sp. SKADARSKE-3]
MVAIDGCCYSTSTGDQAGSGGGVCSGTVGDKVEFANCSFDIKIEGKGVCRNDDLAFHNNKNTIGKNHDSSASPPKSSIPPPAPDTLHIKVVEHLSWDAYDEKAKTFNLGFRENKPLERKFRVKGYDGAGKEVTNIEAASKSGLIEIPKLRTDCNYELIYESEDAKVNNRDFLFKLTLFERDEKEQNDPNGKKIKQMRGELLTGVDYVISLYQPPVIVDAHMHIESGNCAPMPFLWDQAKPLAQVGDSREKLEGALQKLGQKKDWFAIQDEVEVPGAGGKVKEKRRDGLLQTIPLAKKTTFQIGNEFVRLRLNEVNEIYMKKQGLYINAPRLLFFSIAQTMDMEFAHVDGYYGLKVYNGVYKSVADEQNVVDRKPIKYWTPWHGDKHEAEADKDPALDVFAMDDQTEEEFNKNSEIMKDRGIPGVYYTEDDEPVWVNVKSTPFIMPASETERYESWEKQRDLTKLAVLNNPLKLIPMYHFDPRRWQIDGRGIDEPFENVSGNGLHLGFKMYTAQGYRPWDIRRLPILKKFYKRCSDAQIPLMNHCTPEGACTFDKKAFREFYHPADNEEYRKRQKEYWINTNYFDDDFVSPNACKEVLEKNRNLRLCLAHFGGDTSKGREWSGQIIELMKNYDDVYADISSSFADGDFRDYFKNTICKDAAFQKTIRKKILFGTDWYMTLMDKVEYLEYCRRAKEFLDTFDTSLWLRFTQDNPYRFYRLGEGRIENIAENIINIRQNDKKIGKEIGPLDPKIAENIRKEAKYIAIELPQIKCYRRR